MKEMSEAEASGSFVYVSEVIKKEEVEESKKDDQKTENAKIIEEVLNEVEKSHEPEVPLKIPKQSTDTIPSSAPPSQLTSKDFQKTENSDADIDELELDLENIKVDDNIEVSFHFFYNSIRVQSYICSDTFNLLLDHFFIENSRL